MCWSVWMIQFIGRWAPPLLEYIEETMAEVPAVWAQHSQDRPKSNLSVTARLRTGRLKDCYLQSFFSVIDVSAIFCGEENGV